MLLIGTGGGGEGRAGDEDGRDMKADPAAMRWDPPSYFSLPSQPGTHYIPPPQVGIKLFDMIGSHITVKLYFLV